MEHNYSYQFYEMDESMLFYNVWYFLITNIAEPPNPLFPLLDFGKSTLKTTTTGICNIVQFYNEIYQ